MLEEQIKKHQPSESCRLDSTCTRPSWSLVAPQYTKKPYHSVRQSGSLAHIMVEGGNFGYVWRQSNPTTTYAVCNDLVLSTGRIIYHGTTIVLGQNNSTPPTSITSTSSATSTASSNFGSGSSSSATGVYASSSTESVQYLLQSVLDVSTTAAISSQPTTAPYFSQVISAPIITYSPFCIHGSPVTYVRDSQLKSFFSLLTTDTQSWQDYINGPGIFRSSIFPLLYSISICMFISWILTLAAFVSRRKRPALQLLAMCLSTIYLTMIFALAVDNMSDQYVTGYFDVHSLDDVFSRRYVFGVCIGFNTILLFSQVQTTIGLFPRQKEKRLIFWIGIVMDIVAEVLWGISVTEPSKENILAAFVYLLQIAIATLYAFCVTVYFVTRRRVAVQLNMLFFTTITILTVLMPIVLFIVDVNGWWIVNWVDSLSWTSTLLSIITVWEWSQYVEEIHTKQEHAKILGYQFYDESYADVCGDVFDFDEVMDDDENFPKPGGNGISDACSVEENSVVLSLDRGPSWIPAIFNSPSPTPSPHFWHFVSHGIVDPFVKVTDMVVALCSTPKSRLANGIELEPATTVYENSEDEMHESEPESAVPEKFFHPSKRAVPRLNPIVSEASEPMEAHVEGLHQEEQGEHHGEHHVEESEERGTYDNEISTETGTETGNMNDVHLRDHGSVIENIDESNSEDEDEDEYEYEYGIPTVNEDEIDEMDNRVQITNGIEDKIEGV